MARLLLRNYIHKSVLHVLCYNRNCKNDKTYDYYNWEEAKNDNWKFKRESEELRGTTFEDMFLKDSAGNLISIYCPECEP